VHQRVGQRLLARSGEDVQERLFEIVEHLNRGRSRQPEELRLRVVELNLAAGKRSLGSGAVAAADGYLSEQYREADWESLRAQGFDLYLQSAESALQNGRFDAALALLDALERRAPSRFEIAQIAAKRVQIYALVEKPEVSVRYMLAVLQRLGVRWPLHPSRARAALALRWIGWLMRGRDPVEVMRPATSVDLDWLAPMMVISQTGGALIRFDTHLTALASCFILRRYVQRGAIARAAFTLASYANWVQIILGNPEEARRFAQAALTLHERAPDPVYGPRLEIQIHGMLNPWLMRRRQALAPLERAAETMLELGDVEFSYYSRFLRFCYLALAGDPVETSHASLRKLVAAVQRSGYRYPEPDQCERVYRHLTLDITPGEFDEAIATSDVALARDEGWVHTYPRILWMMVLCVHGRHDLAWKQSELAVGTILRTAPLVHVADFYFYRGLAAAVLAGAASGRERRGLQRALREARQRLQRWAKGGPDFAHMAWLLDAEDARLRGDDAAARGLYERAAQRARAQEFMHHVAMAHERRGRLLLEQRRWTDGSAALSAAIQGYLAWGVAARARTLADELQAKLT
jgi:tetratricopeptide (TPR) repeat protein